MKQKPFFDLRLFITSFVVLIVLFLLGKIPFLEIGFVYQIFGAVSVYLLGIIQNSIIPALIEKKMQEQDIEKLNLDKLIYRVGLLENRIDEILQIVYKCQASIEASFLDEILEEERLNTGKIQAIEKFIRDFKEKSFWRYVRDDDNTTDSTLI